jgi:hypothetical protein
MELNNVRNAFHLLEEGQTIPPGCQFIQCHLVFDVKLDGFKFKSRVVTGGLMVDAPRFLTYASMIRDARTISREETLISGFGFCGKSRMEIPGEVIPECDT